MVEFHTVNLKGRIKPKGSIEFLSAEVPATYRSPFARVWYAAGGLEQQDALRLDMEKQVCLDEMPDEAQEKAIKSAVPEIIRLIVESIGNELVSMGRVQQETAASAGRTAKGGATGD